MRTLGVLLAYLIPLCALGSCDSERGFVLTCPKHLNAGTTEHLSFTVVNEAHSGTVNVKIVDWDTDEVLAQADFIAVNQMNLWVEIDIPPVPKDVRAKLRVSGVFSGGYKIEGEKEVLVRHASVVTFVQTDKPIYKPGQIVKFRVLPLDNHLKPLDRKKKGRVWIQDPSDVIMAEWGNLAFHKGIIQLELPLSPEPPLGTWSIGTVIDETTTYHQTFQVQKYVLPKFEVKVKPPPFVMADANIIPVEVCAWYTYGKKVDGTFKVKVSYKRHSWEKKNRAIPSIKYSGLISGCETINIHTHDLLMQTHEYGYRTLNFFAVVTENGTEAEGNASALLDITHSPLQLTFLGQEEGQPDYFKPSLPYFGQVLVSKPDGMPVANEKVEICAHYYDKGPSFYNPPAPKERRCHLFTTDKQGMISFSVAPCTSDILKIALVAEAVSYEPVQYHPGVWREKLVRPSATLELRAWYSPSGNYMQIQPVFEEMECDSRVALMVRFTLEKDVSVQFFHLVMARGRLVQQGSHQRFYYDMDHKKAKYDLPAPRPANNTEHPEFGEFLLAFEPRATMAPLARVLMFYVRDDGEIVADARVFKIEQCFKNKVNLHFRHEQQYPSTEATMLLTATPSSLCGIGLVDKSVRLHKQEEQFTKENIFKAMELFDVGKGDRPRQVTDEFCVRGSSGLKLTPRSFDGLFTPLSSKTSHHVDTIMAFEEAGMVVMTDLKLESRPCVDVQPVAISFNMEDDRRFRIDLSKDSGVEPPGSAVVFPRGPTPQVRETVPAKEPPKPNEADEIRNYFPETWLWEMHSVGSSGQLVVKRQLPHTITQWVGGAVCVSFKTGLGLWEDTSITAFQPFFVSFNLPYSVVRGEVLPLVVTVFNYLSECLPIKLSLEPSEEYRILSESRWQRLCVCGGQSRSHRFSLEPRVLGRVNVTVYGFSLEDDDEAVCGNEVTARLSARDAVSKQLLVEAEGFPKEEVFNYFVCPKKTNGTFATEVDLLLPEDVVNGSARAFVSVTGDLLGPALNGLSHLVKLPVGCGEQNMVLFAPNIFVLQYLTAIGRASEKVREDCLHNMNIGYQRQMRYRHKDGSFSAFGPSDPEGSMWLTAFVMRSMGQARRLMDLPSYDLVATANYILSRQFENGCFEPSGRILNKAMKGGLIDGETSLAPLTAYVLISLMESGTQAPDRESIRNGLRCLETEQNPNTYTLALFAYATTLAQAKRAAQHYLNKLEERAILRGGHKYWDAPPGEGGSKAVNVEIAGYYILSRTKLEGAKSVPSVLPVVRWIVQQRNSRGGFVSTQDTVIGLQALAQYSALQLSTPRDIGLVVESDDLVQGFKVDEYNKLVTQAARIPVLPAVVDLQAVGEGCALVQFTLRYNVEKVSGSEALDLSVTAVRMGSSVCNLPRLDICIRYKIPDQKTNMAVVSVKMPSGFLPDDWSLHEVKLCLTNAFVAELRIEPGTLRLEVQYANHYTKGISPCTELTNDPKCFKFFIKSDTEVEEMHASTVKLFDYYQPDLEISKDFTIPTSCSNPSLPDIPEFPLPTFPIETEETYSILPVPAIEHASTTRPMLDCDESVTEVPNMAQPTGLGTETAAPNDTFTHHITEETSATASGMPEVVSTEGLFLETTLSSSEGQVDEQADDANLHQKKDNTSHLVNFVDVGQDLDFPEGIEGNVPVSVLPTLVETTTSEAATEAAPSCPMCTTQFPEDFNDLYCNSAFALRVVVRDGRAGTVKILQDISYFLPHSKQMKKFAKLEYDQECACSQLREKGSTHFIMGTPTDLWSSELEKHRIRLTSQVRVISTPPKSLQLELLKTARKTCSSDP
ncbi:unnamed protein product [Larinioides sclopetarius]|uniref:TEP1-F n=1 Tax=Larinioides sclopetarius TaxID=280406 RepID=A0AAV2BTF9_9ARAC